ncbi:hypothetical protein PPECC33_p3154 (plasmid) [Escherichia coli PCN033]|nr:hypothetical protein PPECC33_p3154 [Escherichia coli PCN033]UMW92223.1 hypothetical protein [Escherichia coli]UMW92598.1 hypothetical protein [Escherichia coli]UMW93660.1 hypothetical protein [Escherichia coli]
MQITSMILYTKETEVKFGCHRTPNRFAVQRAKQQVSQNSM